MSAKKEIRVSASLYAARNGYVFVREDEYDEKRVNGCAEGHDIKYGYVFSNGEDEIVLGGVCQHKYILFKMWKNLEASDLTDDLKAIGEKFWTIERDGLWGIIQEIVQREGFKIDFTTIPPPDKIAGYREIVARLVPMAFALAKARARESLKRAKASKRALAFLEDPDYASIYGVKVTSSIELEDKRKDLLSKFEKYGWTQAQRRLVHVIASKCDRAQAPAVSFAPGTCKTCGSGDKLNAIGLCETCWLVSVEAGAA